MLTSGACDEGGAGRRRGQGRGSGARRMAASRSGSRAAFGAALRSGAGAALNLGSRRRRGCAERARRPMGDGGGESGELDLGEVAVGKDEPRG